jgi:hypothetical protein
MHRLWSQCLRIAIQRIWRIELLQQAAREPASKGFVWFDGFDW